MPRSNLNSGARWAFALVGALACAQFSAAGELTISGVFTQSTQDGTGPAVNNPSLNNIADGDAFTLLLNFSGPLAVSGTTTMTGVTLTDITAGVSESGFGPFLCDPSNGNACLTVTADGSFYDFSALVCVTSGSGCAFSNQLSANFQIPAASLTSQNVSASGLDQPHPLDLLEDDGITDLHGSISMYSFTGSVTPEPSSTVCIACALAALLLVRKSRKS